MKLNFKISRFKLSAGCTQLIAFDVHSPKRDFSGEQSRRDALLQLGMPPRHLRRREVPVPVVHCLELAAIDGNARRR
jgi:hypothetical protein